MDTVLGHGEIWQGLLAQFQRGRLAHALAFVGPSGIGKKKVAWALAQALVCEHENPPCGECPSCRRVENSQSESILFLEPEKGTIKLDAVHPILQFLNLQLISRARVIIIDGAQLLNPQAGNSILKVLEEPPPQTYFILLIPEFSQLLPTLRSRLQVVRFSPLSDAQLKSDQTLPEWMVRSARGSFEQLTAFQDAKSEELRSLAFDFLSGALGGQREGLHALLDQVKDRDSALSSIHFLQQLLRDWSVLETQDVIHLDLLPRLQAFPQVEPGVRMDLWKSAFQLETDFIAHVDKSLLFENFFYRAKNSLG